MSRSAWFAVDIGSRVSEHDLGGLEPELGSDLGPYGVADSVRSEPWNLGLLASRG